MPKLVNYSQARLDDPSYAEDITQTAFIILIKKYDSLAHDNLSFWMLQVVDYLIKNKNRKEENRKSIIEVMRIDDFKEERLFQCENISYVQDIVLRNLSKDEADYFNTYFVLCESHEEAAKKYNISITASKARKCRMRARIVQILKENGITPSAVSK